MQRIYSYVVRYDSGFAPNPFYGYCTLATCKPDIRRSADVDDWIVGCGSNDRKVRLGGRLVYAMRVTEAMSFGEYNSDPRFKRKKPYRHGSRKQSCGDNIYSPRTDGCGWSQRDSFHTRDDGSPEPNHIKRDTGVNRVLISTDFVYFGGEAPLFDLRDNSGKPLCKSGRGMSCFNEPETVARLVDWIRSLDRSGYQGRPHEWSQLRG